MGQENRFRRFDGNGRTQKSLLRRVLPPVVMLIFWLAITFAALLKQMRDGPNMVATAIICGIGLFGAYGLFRSIIRHIRNHSNQP